jgi:transposase
MAEAYPIELRQRVVAAYLSGEGTYEVVAGFFRLGSATVKRWVSQHRRAGHVRPTKKGGGTPSDVDSIEIAQIVSKLGDATANEITAEYNRHRRGASRRHASSIKRALHRVGFVVKKNDSGRSNSYVPPSRPDARLSCGRLPASRSTSSSSSTNRA